MKFVKSLFCAVLAGVMALGSVASFAKSEDAPSAQLTENDAISCYGNLLKTKGGEYVTLRGTNIGSWLLMEEWMCGYNGADANLGLIEKLESRFGTEKAQELIDTYEDNFFTEYDLDLLESLGFNCLRVPFWYRNLQTDDNGTWKRDKDGNIDFSRLDWVVEQCGKRGIYVILDMHGLPGFQSASHSCGKVNGSVLYDQTEEGEYYRQLSVELWKAVAAHFRGNPTVAAYDLMNEPMNEFPDEQKDDAAIAETYDLLYDAVRSADTEHVVIAEGIWRFQNLPDPQKYGWKNIIYELHLYNEKTYDYKKAVLESKLKLYGVPIYIGEFHPSASTAPWNEILDCFNKNQCSWTTWTYKGYCKWGDSSDWFMFGVSGDERVVDLDNDSFETIKTKWTNVKTQNGYREMVDIEMFSDYAKQERNVGIKEKASALFAIILTNVKRTFFSIVNLFV